jgi:hypothetical protein
MLPRARTPMVDSKQATARALARDAAWASTLKSQLQPEVPTRQYGICTARDGFEVLDKCLACGAPGPF